MTDLNVFLKQFESYIGKRFDVVSGRNAYTFDKFKHAKMLEDDGVYLLLENQPIENLKRKYNKGLFIPARVVDKFFSTSDPEKVKRGFYVGADKMRFEFRNQQHKLYETDSCLIKEVHFEDTRTTYRVEREEFEFLKKNKGAWIFMFTAGDKPRRLVHIQPVYAEGSTFFGDTERKSATLHFDLPVYALKMLDDFGWRKFLTKEKVPPKPIFPLNTKPAATDGSKVVENYLGVGLPITLVFPEGEHELVLECTITKQERRKKEA